MEKCEYCGQSDESRIITNMWVVKGEVRTIDICFDCFWREKLNREAEGNGKRIPPEERRIERKEFAEVLGRLRSLFP